MYDQITCVWNKAIEVALLSEFLHQELTDLYPDEPECVLIIKHVVLAKVIGDGGLEPSQLTEIPGLENFKQGSQQADGCLEQLKKDAWIRLNSRKNLLVPGDIFRLHDNATINHLNRMINQVFKSLHRKGDRPENLKETLATDKMLKNIWDKEASENETLLDL